MGWLDVFIRQTSIAQTIIDQQADYVLALKANQGQFYQDVMDWFDWARHSDFKGMAYDYDQTVNKGHGRIASSAAVPSLTPWPLFVQPAR
jgi:predicted transposase YbfD/YdcC